MTVLVTPVRTSARLQEIGSKCKSNILVSLILQMLLSQTDYTLDSPCQSLVNPRYNQWLEANGHEPIRQGIADPEGELLYVNRH